MSSRRSFAISALLLAACAATSPTRGPEAQLEREYAEIVAGFLRGDPEPWISRLTPEFTLKLFSGSDQSREWVVEYVRNNARVFTIDTLSMSILEITPVETGVVVRVRQTSSRHFRDEAGQLQKLDVDAIQLEEWTRLEGRWMLRHVTESEVIQVKTEPVPAGTR
jgi:hypothetical protein